MKKIDGKPKSLRQLLTGVKYTVHYYQREYMWRIKQIEELMDDLTDEFSLFYDPNDSRKQVSNYGHYFMGSIVLTSNDNNENAIIDGQQRLTSLTLLLIYIYHLLEDDEDKGEVQNLIYSQQFGEKSFNINVEDRTECLNALFRDKLEDFKPNGESESVRNIYNRYLDIDEIFPDDLKGEALPFFKDWLIDKVDFIEITADTEQDAHKIFVSMNDRGLSLTPTEMLKGYLLSEISDDEQRNKANDVWKKTILELKDLDKDEDSTFIKTWLRAQYAETIRETKRDAVNKDFDIIGTTFHKWVRENTKTIDLNKPVDFENFVLHNFTRYAEIYIKIWDLATDYDPDFKHVFYNDDIGFTLQSQVILAAISIDDNDKVVDEKIKVVSRFLDQFAARRVFNYKNMGYSTIKNSIFNLTKKVRNLPLDELKKTLYDEINTLEFTLEGIDSFGLNGYTKRFMLHLLARLTHHVEEQSGMHTKFEDYVDRNIKHPYDIEHIWADHFEDHKKEFKNENEFQEWRNFFGALLILPRDKNRSYNDSPYTDKVKMYFSENLLARSLNDKCYKNNPNFLKYIRNNNLDFKPYKKFTVDSIEERQDLYKELAYEIWNPELIKNLDN
ncbi:MAG: DUF262 domain-containing protein [Bacteroidetes bacterium]|nr:DUF262 domain-containing protein [Bacteroidota bacterium]